MKHFSQSRPKVLAPLCPLQGTKEHTLDYWSYYIVVAKIKNLNTKNKTKKEKKRKPHHDMFI